MAIIVNPLSIRLTSMPYNHMNKNLTDQEKAELEIAKIMSDEDRKKAEAMKKIYGSCSRYGKCTDN